MPRIGGTSAAQEVVPSVPIVRRRGPGEREVIRLSLVDVEKRIARGQAEADLELWPDLLVVIPSAVRVACVLGAVNKPGQIKVPNVLWVPERRIF